MSMYKKIKITGSWGGLAVNGIARSLGDRGENGYDEDAGSSLV